MIKQETKSTKIYTVFFPTDGSSDLLKFEGYQKYHPDIKMMENQEILERVKNECKDVEFVGKAELAKVEEVISSIKEQKKDLDGVLVFGPLPDELISIGLPILAIQRLFDWCSTVPFHAYKESKVVTSCLPALRDKDPNIYSLRIEDIVRKIKLIDAIAKMKDLKVLVITDLPPLGYFEPIELQIEMNRKKYEKTYLSNLKETFGTEFITVPQKELFEKIKVADGKKARQIAQKWILEAIALRGTNEAEVVKSAKLYLAMKELMEEYNCSAITTEGFGWPPLGYEKSVKEDIPSQGLPTTQFCTDGIVAASETLII